MPVRCSTNIYIPLMAPNDTTTRHDDSMKDRHLQAIADFKCKKLKSLHLPTFKLTLEALI